MKKQFKKMAAVLMCVWNLYMPTPMQEDTQIQSTPMIVEEVIVEPIEQEVDERKQVYKRILSFIPSVVHGLFYVILSLLKGSLQSPFVLCLLLLLVGWFLLKNKPWACVMGMLVGIVGIVFHIYQEDTNFFAYFVNVLIVFYFVSILIFGNKKQFEINV